MRIHQGNANPKTACGTVVHVSLEAIDLVQQIKLILVKSN